jgi:peroxiredoxin
MHLFFSSKPLVQGGLSFSGYERDALFMNLGTKQYLEISGISGLDSKSDGRGAIYADFDNDGDLDVFLTTIQGPTNLLFRNNVGQNSSWLRVSLEGVHSGRDAFGTIVRVKSGIGVQTKVKLGGEGYLAQHDPRLLFGLGADRLVDWIEVTWPSGLKQRFENIPASTHLRITEGQYKFETIAQRPANLPEPLPGEELLLRTLKIQKGKPFPEIEVATLEDRKGQLRSFLTKRKEILLTLWATWCASCARELTELERLRPQLHGKNIEIIGLSLDTGSSAKVKVKTYLKKYGLSFPVFLAGEDAVERIYDVKNIWVPLSVLIDESGVVRDLFTGPSNKVLRRIEYLTSD